MLTPFDEKTKLAQRLDSLATKLIAFVLCLLFAFYTFGSFGAATVSGTAIFVCTVLLFALWQRSTLLHRDETLRRRVGGMLAIDALLLVPTSQAHWCCANYLSELSDIKEITMGSDGALALFEDDRILVRCDQACPGDSSGQGSVLSAQRAALNAGACRAILCTTTHFDKKALFLAEQLDPPVRLVDSDVLCAVAGRLHPATDSQLVTIGRMKKSPFSWPRLSLHVFAPQKVRRYLLYAFALLMLYLLSDQLYYLLPSIFCYTLAILSHRNGQKPFRL